MRGQFSAFHDLLYDQYDSLGTKSLAWFAMSAGIADTMWFNACLEGQESDRQVLADMEAAKELGVRGTPTFLINDLLVAGFPGLDQLRTYVTDAIKKRPVDTR